MSLIFVVYVCVYFLFIYFNLKDKLEKEWF